ncbi:MAG TPA: hypothetical protein VHN77_04215 [Phycisphaerales bacterium]|nr:hypothetical protein [Phycisphaerales bacterium]
MVALTAHTEPTTPEPAPSAQPEPFPRAHLLHLLLDPTKSLHDVAATLHTTVDHLSLFLTSDQGEALLSQAERTTALRTRALAAAQLHKAIAALATMLDDDNANAKLDTNPNADPGAPNTEPTNLPSATTLALLRHKHQDQARRAAHLLLRLANFSPPPRGTGLPPGGSAQATHNHRAPSPALPTRATQSPVLQPGQSPPPAPTRATLQSAHEQPVIHAQSSLVPSARCPLPSLPPRPPASSAFGSVLVPPATPAADRREGPARSEGQVEGLRASPSKTHQLIAPPPGRTTAHSQLTTRAPTSPRDLLHRTGAPPPSTPAPSPRPSPLPLAHSPLPAP